MNINGVRGNMSANDTDYPVHDEGAVPVSTVEFAGLDTYHTPKD